MRIYRLAGGAGELGSIIAAIEADLPIRIGNMGIDEPVRIDGFATLSESTLEIALYEEGDAVEGATFPDLSWDISLVSWLIDHGWTLV